MSQSSPTSNAASDNNNSNDWRKSVAQSTRSAEVRAVADMLAKMEHGATASSKLMLAMRFEDDTFNKATSLADYQKRIQKRLKKFTKNYKATAPSPVPTPTNVAERLQELKRKYGERLLFIVQNADKAINIIHKKNEPDKAKTLKQHTDNVKTWATNLGVLPGTSLDTAMDNEAVEDMALLLERRVDNIRNHVMKLASMDLLLQETLEKLEHDLTEHASQLLATATSRRLTRLNWTDFADPVKALQDFLQKAQAPIPPPTRDTQRNVALLQLERLKNAAQAILAFLAIPNKQSTALPQDVLLKCHTAAIQTLDFLGQTMPELIDSKEKEQHVKLQDAWTKALEYPTESDEASLLSSSSSNKRRKTSTTIRSRVLLTPGRKTPSNLLPELKRKGAKLVRPLPNGEGTYLSLTFGDAFEMTIYLVPLLVTIRACTTENGDRSDTDNDSVAVWTPIQSGLEEHADLEIWGVTGTPAMLGNVVQGQLDYASTCATSLLRKYFSTTAISATNDFEVEISEGTALLQFLQLARTTYTPNYEAKE